MSTQWFNQSLSQLRQALQQQQVDIVTVMSTFYQRIQQRDHQVQAWQYLVSEQEYLKQYQTNMAFYKNSLLQGLPFAVKDVIDTMGIVTSMGSQIHQGRVPLMDAAVVTAIQQAGGILLGKTVTTEFAYFKAGKTRNPHDPRRTPGGSSSGSAAAVADFMVPFALGTQTAASVIRPAAYCGCLAYVASHNQFSLRNIQPLASSLDSLGLFANDFLDLRLMRQIMQLDPQRRPQMTVIKPSRIAYCFGDHLGDIDQDMCVAMQTLLEQLQHLRIDCVAFPNTIDLKALEHHHIQIMSYEVARNLQLEYQTGMMSEPLMALIEQGLALPYVDYLVHLQQVEKIKNQYQHWMETEHIQFTIAPAAAGVAPLGLDKTGVPFMSRPWQAMGLPVTTFPMRYKDKLPLGVQLIGGYQQDEQLLCFSQYLHKFIENEMGAVI